MAKGGTEYEAVVSVGYVVRQDKKRRVGGLREGNAVSGGAITRADALTTAAQDKTAESCCQQMGGMLTVDDPLSGTPLDDELVQCSHHPWRDFSVRYPISHFELFSFLGTSPCSQGIEPPLFPPVHALQYSVVNWVMINTVALRRRVSKLSFAAHVFTFSTMTKNRSFSEKSPPKSMHLWEYNPHFLDAMVQARPFDHRGRKLCRVIGPVDGAFWSLALRYLVWSNHYQRPDN